MSAKNKKERADKLIVDQGLVPSRTQAERLIMAGQVCLGDRLVKKPSELFEFGLQFRLKDGALSPFVSRGGEKLKGALQESGLNVSGFNALDIGISTGGFTDCLLQNGAVQVVGVDVGHNQLDWKIKNDPRVKSYEGINAREVDVEKVPELNPENLKKQPLDLAVIDVSFISLTLILPQAKRFVRPGGHILALIKPQFEVDKGQVGKGGIVKDPLLHTQVQDKIRKFSEEQGLTVLKIFSSPIEGTDGNKEFFLFARC